MLISSLHSPQLYFFSKYLYFLYTNYTQSDTLNYITVHYIELLCYMLLDYTIIILSLIKSTYIVSLMPLMVTIFTLSCKQVTRL